MFLEPELFQKVTGLTVKDFDVLCSIGLFDAEKMNQGIFGFRKYENSSLSYTGIDKHEGESVGGWDTVLRREEYEALYSKQQATLAETKQNTISDDTQANDAPGEKPDVSVTPAAVETGGTAEKETDKWAVILSQVGIGADVSHKKFGDGVVMWIDKGKKYLRVKFSVGEKQFIFPDAFVMGFLELK